MSNLINNYVVLILKNGLMLRYDIERQLLLLAVRNIANGAHEEYEIGGSLDPGGVEFTQQEKDKLSTVQQNANYYVLPDELPATIIKQTNDYKFVSVADIERFDDKYTKNEIDELVTELFSNLEWKNSVETRDDIETTYPEPLEGWIVSVNDENRIYRFNELNNQWADILDFSAIPNATDTIKGISSFNEDDFVVSNGHVAINKNTIASKEYVNSQLQKAIELLDIVIQPTYDSNNIATYEYTGRVLFVYKQNGVFYPTINYTTTDDVVTSTITYNYGSTAPDTNWNIIVAKPVLS